MLKRVIESELDDARQYLLVNVVETYFPLSGDELEEFNQVVTRKEYSKVQDTDLTWGDKLLLKGLIQGKREALKRLLTAKFGALPSEVVIRIDAIESEEALDQYLERVLTAQSVEDVGLSGF